MKNQLYTLGIAVTCVVGLAVPVRATTSDAWITTKTKMALLTTEGVSGTAINVDTVDGQVMLHGNVPTIAEKEKAEGVARGIEGVRKVRTALQVVPARREEAVRASDADLTPRVTAALEPDPALKDVHVASIHDGVVLLSGTTATMTAQLRAIVTASRVPGVRRVASEVQGPDKLTDHEVWADNDKHAPVDAGKGSVVSDLWITSATKIRLLADSRTPALDINVDTTDGVVTLFGMVGSKDAKRAAEEDARKIASVRLVKNELQVVRKEQQETVKARDEDVVLDVKRALDARDDLHDTKIGVAVKSGVARLTGTVPSQDQRISAAVTARATLGVRSVEDDLLVGPVVD